MHTVHEAKAKDLSTKYLKNVFKDPPDEVHHLDEFKVAQRQPTCSKVGCLYICSWSPFTYNGNLLRPLIYRLVLCDTWNRNDDNDTVSGIAILDTTTIPEMRYAISN